jgi:hypothetical protein
VDACGPAGEDAGAPIASATLASHLQAPPSAPVVDAIVQFRRPEVATLQSRVDTFRADLARLDASRIAAHSHRTHVRTRPARREHSRAARNTSELLLEPAFAIGSGSAKRHAVRH